MQPYYELAYALASESLCLFVGTGFSKHLTGGAAPDWKTLLKQCCSVLTNPDLLIEELFPDDQAFMPLEECASIISLQMKKEGRNIYGAIADEISKLQSDPTIAKPTGYESSTPPKYQIYFPKSIPSTMQLKKMSRPPKPSYGECFLVKRYTPTHI